MILEYNYEKALHVLELLKESKIASLDIVTKENNVIIMEYKLIEEFPEHTQRQIRRTLADAMPRRLRLIELFNNIIVTKAAGKDIQITLHLNALGVRKCKIDYHWTGDLLKSSDEDSLTALRACLERVDSILINMGISSQKINAYTREGGGRQKKYTQLTLKDFSSIVMKTAEE